MRRYFEVSCDMNGKHRTQGFNDHARAVAATRIYAQDFSQDVSVLSVVLRGKWRDARILCMAHADGSMSYA